MLNTVSRLKSADVIADDGNVGPIREVFFDDHAWVIRHLVVDTGSWLSERNVLVSPYAIRQPLEDGGAVHVNLTRQQVRDSPDIDAHQPVSRRHERALARYYNYPDYWDGGGMWGGSSLPIPAPVRPTQDADDTLAEDVHLRSSAAVSGYHIQASDGSIGHVEDFIFDDRSFAIRYLRVDTRNWWPGGRKVLLAVSWIDRIDWAEKAVYTTLSREQIQNSPPYDESMPLHREYERRLYDTYNRAYDWE